MSSKNNNPENKSDAMRELRLKTLTTQPSEFGITPTPDFPTVYGILMDWPVGKEIITVVSLCDGNASLYSTSTFGVIGGFSHKAVREQAIEFVKCGSDYFNQSAPTSEFTYPKLNQIRFYLLTFDGVKVINTDLNAISNSNNEFSKLFSYGQLVITELRKIVESDSNDDSSPIKKEWFGETGYVNCLLTIMSKGIISSVEIIKNKPVPNLMKITEVHKETQLWIEKQDFSFNLIDSEKVINIIKKSSNIKGFPFSTRASYLQSIHAQNDGKNVARVFEINIGPFNKFAKINMALDNDPRVIDLQNRIDTNQKMG